ncbi:LamG domain-containing protein [Flagellimonas algicola]|uniref:LamG domain-containing protein n=1 Tax=Flagellimonas algicola TaxID=2583815 RepID=A0ABY2WJ30_9FLAO|nr:LamG domain-containing protein [Allomuricauda algicola]TMU54605.1 LamG domain-containing protein [Allomuricauda algicola]
MSRNTIWVVLLAVASVFSCKDDSTPEPSNELFAYHTSLRNSDKAHQRYEDLIVKLDAGQLEFRLENTYAPVWTVGDYNYPIQDLFPNREVDQNSRYSYVRLMEQSDDKIVVHYTHRPKLSGLFASIDENPLYTGGITNVIHEIFIIEKDYSITRYLKNAEGTRYEDWVHPEFGSIQKIQLEQSGITHGELQHGKSAPIYPRAPFDGNAVLEIAAPTPLLSWTFNDGMQPHEDFVVEAVTETNCPIKGLSTHYEKGISGTALAFDGYYTSVSLAEEKVPEMDKTFSISSWIAPDAYPYNKAPIIHQSKGWGKEGFYLGLDPYGHIIFSANGEETKSKSKVDFGKWSFIGVSVNNATVELSINGKVEVSKTLKTPIDFIDAPIQIGMNNELDRGSDFVRTNAENIDYFIGFQGLIDELAIFDSALDADTFTHLFDKTKPEDFTSSLALSVLPGESETGKFGAYYTDLTLNNALWDNLWRNVENPDIVVEFDDVKGSVKFWRGTNYASNWISDNNIWMADQSTETWGPHGCSEHMADKQNRQSYARIIENNPARAIIHWKYPCVDVGYINNNDETNWSDEYYYIYPDGTAVRKVNFNGRGLPETDDEDTFAVDEDEEEGEEEEELSEFSLATMAWGETMAEYRDTYYHPENDTWTEENIGAAGPGFQDVQILLSPGVKALDLVGLNAMDVANLKGDVQKLQWELPNKTPFVQIHDASIELVKTKSEYKTFEVFQGGYITPWGLAENSDYTDDPFAGPWNHWPVNLLPSDGRYAIGNDRIGHFALGANDFIPSVGAMVLHGMTNQSIESLIPLARSWKLPPPVTQVQGATSVAYSKEQKAFLIDSSANEISFTINASEEQPIVNPAFVLSNWNGDAKFSINGQPVSKDIRTGIERDANGKKRLVIWLKYTTSTAVNVSITAL